MIDVLLKTEYGHVALPSEQIISINDRADGTCLIVYQSLDKPATVISSQPAIEVFQAIRDAQCPAYPDPRRDTIPPALYEALGYYSRERLEWMALLLRHPPTAIQVIHDALQQIERLQ